MIHLDFEMEYEYDFDFTEIEMEDTRGIIWRHIDPQPIFDWCEMTFGQKGGRWNFAHTHLTKPWSPGITALYANAGIFGFHSAGDHLLFTLYMNSNYRLEPR